MPENGEGCDTRPRAYQIAMWDQNLYDPDTVQALYPSLAGKLLEAVGGPDTEQATVESASVDIDPAAIGGHSKTTVLASASPNLI